MTIERTTEDIEQFHTDMKRIEKAMNATWRRGVRDEDGYIFDRPDLTEAKLICEVAGTRQERVQLMEQIVREHNAYAAMREALQAIIEDYEHDQRKHGLTQMHSVRMGKAALAAGEEQA